MRAASGSGRGEEGVARTGQVNEESAMYAEDAEYERREKTSVVLGVGGMRGMKGID